MMTELSDKERAYAALEKLASSDKLTKEQQIKLYDDVHYYICDLNDELRILG